MRRRLLQRHVESCHVASGAATSSSDANDGSGDLAEE